MKTFIKRGKSCGCPIATNAVLLEIQKRKKVLELSNLKKKIAGAKDKKSLFSLKKKSKEVSISLSQAVRHKKNMKKRFEKYIETSGYVPPKFKHRS